MNNLDDIEKHLTENPLPEYIEDPRLTVALAALCVRGLLCQFEDYLNGTR